MSQKIINKLENAIDTLSKNIDNYFTTIFSSDGVGSLIDIKMLQGLSDEELKEFTKKSIKLITLSDNSDYHRCSHLGELAKIISTLDIDLAKLYIKKALKYSDISQMYGIASNSYLAFHDKPFSTKIYKKAIKRSLQVENTSHLHLLGQSMSDIDVAGDDYFQKWGEEIKAKAKWMNDEQKLKAKKIKPTYTHDIQIIDEMNLTSNTFLREAEDFLMKNAQLEVNEILYVVKATKTVDEKVIVHGAYYGLEMSPLQFLVNSKEYSEDVFLAEATSSEAMIEYLLNNKNEEADYNVYLFKVLYKDFRLCKIESLYVGKNDLDFYIFDEYDEKSDRYGKILKRFGEVNYAPSINFFLSEEK